MRAKLYARLIVEGAITIEDVPEKYRLATEADVEKLYANT